MKSFVALLVLSTLAFSAYSQGCLTLSTGIWNTTTGPSTTFTAVANALCAQCGSGYLLSASSGSTCTSISSTGCAWGNSTTYCWVCATGYALNSTSNLCVACATGCSACAITSGTMACTGCSMGYALLSGACLSCASGTTGTAAAPTGITGCGACSTTVTSASVVYWLCTWCSTGILLGTGVPTGGTSTIVVPVCAGLSAGTISTPSQTIAANTVTGFPTALDVNCATGQGSVDSGTGYVQCLTAATGYYCAADWETSFTCLTTATLSSGSTPALKSGVTAPTNCSGGIYPTTGSSLSLTCQQCATGFVLVSGLCTPVMNNCYSYTSASTNAAAACGAAVAGYHLASATSVVACTVGNACNSLNCGSGLALNVTGTCITASSPIANCLIQNGTSSCAICGMGYATIVGSCGSCPSNCGFCSSSTVCAVCNTGYSASSAGACVAKSTAAAGAKALFAGLAFISMIFYYIF